LFTAPTVTSVSSPLPSRKRNAANPSVESAAPAWKVKDSSMPAVPSDAWLPWPAETVPYGES